MNIKITKQDGIVLKTAGKLCEEDVTVTPVLQEKTTAENGEITADSGYTGLSKVTVNVPIPTYEVYEGETEDYVAEGGGSQEYQVTVTIDSSASGVDIYDGQDASGIKLGTVTYGGESLTVTCTTGYLYLFSMYVNKTEESSITSGSLTIVSETASDDGNNIIVKVDSDGELYVNWALD